MDLQSNSSFFFRIRRLFCFLLMFFCCHLEFRKMLENGTRKVNCDASPADEQKGVYVGKDKQDDLVTLHGSGSTNRWSARNKRSLQRRQDRWNVVAMHFFFLSLTMQYLVYSVKTEMINVMSTPWSLLVSSIPTPIHGPLLVGGGLVSGVSMGIYQFARKFEIVDQKPAVRAGWHMESIDATLRAAVSSGVLVLRVAGEWRCGTSAQTRQSIKISLTARPIQGHEPKVVLHVGM